VDTVLRNEELADRKSLIGPATEALDRERRADIAYGMYSQKAMLAFDLDGRAETIRQLRAWMSLFEAIGECAMSERIRDLLQRERSRQIALTTALGEGEPYKVGSVNRSNARGTSRASDTRAARGRRQSRAKSMNPCSTSV